MIRQLSLPFGELACCKGPARNGPLGRVRPEPVHRRRLFASVCLRWGERRAAGSGAARFKSEATIAGGALVIGFGLFTVGVLKLPFLQRDLRVHAALKGSRPVVACLMGVAFAFSWTVAPAAVIDISKWQSEGYRYMYAEWFPRLTREDVVKQHPELP